MTDQLSKQARSLLESAKLDQPTHESVARTAALLGLPGAAIASLVAAENAAAFAVSSSGAASAAAASTGALGTNATLAGSAGTSAALLTKGAAIGPSASLVAKGAVSVGLAPTLLTKVLGASVVVGAVTVGTVSVRTASVQPWGKGSNATPAASAAQTSSRPPNHLNLPITPSSAATLELSEVLAASDETLPTDAGVASSNAQPKSGDSGSNSHAPIVERSHRAPPIDSSRSHGAALETSTSAAVAPQVVSDSKVSRELSYLTRARSALHTSDPLRCLEILTEYEEAFTQGILMTEARILKIEALKLSGSSERAQNEAAEFIRREPSNLHSQRFQSSGRVTPPEDH